MRHHHEHSHGGLVAVVRSLLGVLVVTLGVSWPSAAEAHTDLAGSTPSPGDTVSVTTERLVLVFNDTLTADAGQVVVRDESGADVAAGGPVISGGTVEVAMGLVMSGRHEVAYRVTGSDGHPVVGDFVFDVAEAAAADREPARSLEATVAAAAPDPPTSPPSEQDAAASTPWLLGAATLIALVLLVRIVSIQFVTGEDRPRSGS